MNTVNHKLIKILVILFISSSTFADFSTKQVRYHSVKDIQLNLKNIFPSAQAECLTESPRTSIAFGYSSPVTGKPVSKKPNFNFINTYMQCMKSILIQVTAEDLLPGDSSLSAYANPDTVDQEELRKAVKYQINKLVGPEVVIKSYGYLASEKEFIDLIMQTVKESQSINTVTDFIRESVYFISLRDEFLSY